MNATQNTKIAQKIISLCTDECLGQWSNAVEDGDNEYLSSYQEMAETIYCWTIDRAPEGIRFLGTSVLYAMVFNQIKANINEWGVPLCHNGKDTLDEAMMNIFKGMQ